MQLPANDTRMSHLQFNRDRRIELSVLLNTGKNQSECAEVLGIRRPNVCLEINRNKDPDGVYRGGHAHKRYLARRKEVKKKERKIENDTKLREYIVKKLRCFWSPEQIAGRLKRKHVKTLVSHETIYTFVYEKRPDLVKYLRHHKSKYRKKRGSWARIERNKTMKIKRITERPQVVEKRLRMGDWEGDTIVGKERTQRILTYVERKSGYVMAKKLDEVTAEIVEKKTEECFKKIPKHLRLTLTRDNGIEFGDYDSTLEKRTGMEVFRATPYHSWERGSNENWNGLARQFFPKSTLFATITAYQVEHALRMLNNRPRKRLNYKTPREEFRCNDSG